MYLHGEKRYGANERRPNASEWGWAAVLAGLLGAVGAVFYFFGMEAGLILAEILTTLTYLVALTKVTAGGTQKTEISWRDESPLPVRPAGGTTSSD